MKKFLLTFSFIFLLAVHAHALVAPLFDQNSNNSPIFIVIPDAYGLTIYASDITRMDRGVDFKIQSRGLYVSVYESAEYYPSKDFAEHLAEEINMGMMIYLNPGSAQKYNEFFIPYMKDDGLTYVPDED